MTYGILPNGKQQFINSNGQPLAGGFVYYYIPNTTTFKNTYQDDAGVNLNTNPIVLDANGQCIAYGTGSYRQQVKDVNGNLIWDVQVDSPSVFYNSSNFTSDGSTVSYTLSINPSNINSVFVSINGVLQIPTTNYTLSGSTLTLTSPAPINSVISIRY
jgi:hypothetical protein